MIKVVRNAISYLFPLDRDGFNSNQNQINFNKMKIIKNLALALMAGAIVLVSCSKEDSISIDKATNSKDIVKKNNPVDLSEPTKDLKDLANQFAIDMGKAELLNVDENAPANLALYLSEMQKTGEVFDHISHFEVDTKAEVGVMNIYSLRYASDSSKFLIIYEGDYEDNFAYDINMDITDSNNSISKSSSLTGLSGGKLTFGLTDISPPMPISNPNVTTPNKFYPECFKKCVSKGLDPSKSLMGVLIVGLTAQSWYCLPCGAVAGVYTTIVLVGCAGGCNK